MMNAGGIRVSPIEVEAALTEHPGVTEAGACEVRIGPETTIIAAFWSGPAPLSDESIRAFAADRLATYKIPRLFVRLDQLPRGANNKLLRRALRQDWETLNDQA
jgi:acyl-coenzyme A synthetase/AMP-(fatty) acid ligase